MDDQGRTPQPVQRERVKRHFREIYGLSDEQSEVMIASSAKSMAIFLADLSTAIDRGDPLPEVSRLAHALKGVFLNMGEEQWAAVARGMENSAARDEEKNYREVVDGIMSGVEDIKE